MVAAATALADDCQVSEVAVYHALERRSKSLSSDLQVSVHICLIQSNCNVHVLCFAVEGWKRLVLLIHPSRVRQLTSPFLIGQSKRRIKLTQ